MGVSAKGSLAPWFKKYSLEINATVCFSSRGEILTIYGNKFSQKNRQIRRLECKILGVTLGAAVAT